MTQDHLSEFRDRITELRAHYESLVGADDIAEIRRLQAVSDAAERVGRLLIHFSLEPVSWSLGVLSLFIHWELEDFAIGHTVLHGAYDRLEDPRFHSTRYRLRGLVDEGAWKRQHNQLHHAFTNITGKDPDLNFTLFRFSKHTPWRPLHLVQVPLMLAFLPFTLYGMSFNATGVGEPLRGAHGRQGYADILPDHAPATVLAALRTALRRIVPHVARNYLLFPALAGPLFWKVLLGNLSAEMLHGLFTSLTVLSGHLAEESRKSPHGTDIRGRAAWCQNQVEAAQDYELPEFLSILCGGLNYQIEHHLFPRLPPRRLRQVSAEVRRLCEQHGVRYQSSSWGSLLKSTLRNALKCSVP